MPSSRPKSIAFPLFIFILGVFLEKCCSLKLFERSPVRNMLEMPYVVNDDSEDIEVDWVRVVEFPEGWINCGTNDDLFQFESLEISPNPPQRNKNVTVRVVGNLQTELSGNAKVEYTVKFGSIPIVRDTVDACKMLQEYPGLPQCPFKSGHYDVTYSELIPLATPMGTYSVNAKGYVMEGDVKRPLFCIEGVMVLKLFNPKLTVNRGGKIQEMARILQEVPIHLLRDLQ